MNRKVKILVNLLVFILVVSCVVWNGSGVSCSCAALFSNSGSVWKNSDDAIRSAEFDWYVKNVNRSYSVYGRTYWNNLRNMHVSGEKVSYNPAIKNYTTYDSYIQAEQKKVLADYLTRGLGLVEGKDSIYYKYMSSYNFDYLSIQVYNGNPVLLSYMDGTSLKYYSNNYLDYLLAIKRHCRNIGYNVNMESTGVLPSEVGKNIYSGDGEVTTLIDTKAGEKPKGIVKLFVNLIVSLGDGLNGLLESAGMGLDNIIFGRVNAKGVNINGTYTTFWHYGLEQGNVYGVVSAAIYQKLRAYLYIVMAVVAMWSLAKAAIMDDAEKAGMVTKEKLKNGAVAFSLMTFMPYFLQIWLLLRDTGLKYVVGGVMKEFSGEGTSLIGVFQSTASDGLMNSFVYFAAVCASLIFGFIYVGVAMGMLIQVIAFPFICIKSIYDTSAFNEWMTETFALSMVPIIDGILLMVPYGFCAVASYTGLAGPNFVALICCFMILTARKQFRNAIGVKSNNSMEGAGIMTAMATMQFARSLKNTVTKGVGTIVGGFKGYSGDLDMANYYDAQAKAESSSGAGEEAGGDGSVAHIDEPIARDASNGAPLDADILNKDGSRILSASGASSTQNGVSSPGTAGSMSTMAPDPVAMEHANINNFDSAAFAGKLSNAKMAEMYRKRAQTQLSKRVLSGAGTLAGGMAGGILGGAAGAFGGVGMSAALAGAGIELGGGLGGFIGEAIGTDASKTAKHDRDGSGEGSAGHTFNGSPAEMFDPTATANEIVPTHGTYSQIYDQIGEKSMAASAVNDDVLQIADSVPLSDESAMADVFYQEHGSQYKDAAMDIFKDIKVPETFQNTYAKDPQSLYDKYNTEVAKKKELLKKDTEHGYYEKMKELQRVQEEARNNFIRDVQTDIRSAIGSRAAAAGAQTHSSEAVQSLVNEKAYEGMFKGETTSGGIYSKSYLDSIGLTFDGRTPSFRWKSKK